MPENSQRHDLIMPDGGRIVLHIREFHTEVRSFLVVAQGEAAHLTLRDHAERIYPQVAAALRLSWRRCVFIERRSPPRQRRFVDSQFCRVHFLQPPRGGDSVSAGPEYCPLDLRLARWLRHAGLGMTIALGQVGWFEPGDAGGCCMARARARFSAPIADFDGLHYYDATGRLIPGRLLMLRARRDAPPQG